MEPVTTTTITTFSIVKLAIKFGIALGIATLIAGAVNTFNKGSFKLKKGGDLHADNDDTAIPHRRH